MAEETPAIQNKGLLVTALVLAAIVVLLYNFQIERAVREARGETIKLLVFTGHLSAGDKVSADDIGAKEVSVEIGASFGQAVLFKDKGSIVGESLSRAVSRDSFVMWDHFDSYGGASSSVVPLKGMAIYALQVDRDKTPGAILGVGDRISVWGMLPVDGKLTSTCIIRGLKVRGIGSGGSQSFRGPKKRFSSTKSLRSYDRILVEVTEEVRRQLENVISHVTGGLGVDKLNPEDSTKDYTQITDEARPFSKSAAGVTTRRP